MSQSYNCKVSTTRICFECSLKPTLEEQKCGKKSCAQVRNDIQLAVFPAVNRPGQLYITLITTASVQGVQLESYQLLSHLSTT